MEALKQIRITRHNIWKDDRGKGTTPPLQSASRAEGIWLKLEVSNSNDAYQGWKDDKY